jgi:5'-3' exonuclease
VPATSAPTLLALDGNSLLHRAYHAYAASGMSRSDGQPIFAVYGFVALLAGILDRVDPQALIVSFDDHLHSVRKAKFPFYKANREKKADDLYSQMDAVHQLLTRMGISVVVEPGWEADDVVASAATVAEQAGWKCVVATSDRDAFSLISEHTTVMRLVSGLDNAQWLTPDELHAKYGIWPQQYTDYAALRGDKSDNLPGVNGIGEKTAAKLLAAMGSVEAALADPDASRAAIGASFSERLVEGQEFWARNVEIMSQRRDLSIDLTASELAGIDQQTVIAALREAELPNLVARFAPKLQAHNPRSRSQRGGRAELVEQPPSELAPGPSDAPPVEEPAGAVSPGSRDRRRFDPDVMRGEGRGLPSKENSTPNVTLPGGRVISTTGGGRRPARMPVTMI